MLIDIYGVILNLKYDIIKRSGDGYNTPIIPEYIDLYYVAVHGSDVNIIELLSESVIEDIEKSLYKHL